jgi:hypothetical protein
MPMPIPNSPFAFAFCSLVLRFSLAWPFAFAFALGHWSSFFVVFITHVQPNLHIYISDIDRPGKMSRFFALVFLKRANNARPKIYPCPAFTRAPPFD